MNPVFITIVFPAYNESARICTALWKVANYVKTVRDNWEVIVVENGSNDDTYETAIDTAIDIAREPIHNIAVRVERSTPGKGSALRYGMALSKGKYVLLSDVDLSTPIREVTRLLGYAIRDGRGVVIGSRNMSTSLVLNRGRDRKFIGFLFNKLTSLLVPGIRDTQCGFKLLSREAVESITPFLTIEGFAIDVELLFVARLLGYDIAEVGVQWEHDTRTTVRVIPDSLKMARDLGRIAVNYASGIYRI